MQNGFEETHEITLDLDLKNIKSNKELPLTIELDPNSEILALTLEAIDQFKGSGYSTRVSHRPKLIIKEIRNEEFEIYTKTIKNTNEIKIRKEDIGNNFVLFLKNGLLEKKKVTIDINPINMKMSKDSPLILEIEPLREKFILILSPIDINKGWSYSVRYSFISVRD